MLQRIKTLHPYDEKEGVRIERAKYDTIRQAVLNALERCDMLTYTALAEDVRSQVGAHFDGSINWYTVVVKLDLEARGLIEPTPGTRPERIRLAKIRM